MKRLVVFAFMFGFFGFAQVALANSPAPTPPCETCAYLVPELRLSQYAVVYGEEVQVSLTITNLAEPTGDVTMDLDTPWGEQIHEVIEGGIPARTSASRSWIVTPTKTGMITVSIEAKDNLGFAGASTYIEVFEPQLGNTYVIQDTGGGVFRFIWFRSEVSSPEVQPVDTVKTWIVVGSDSALVDVTMSWHTDDVLCDCLLSNFIIDEGNRIKGVLFPFITDGYVVPLEYGDKWYNSGSWYFRRDVSETRLPFVQLYYQSKPYSGDG